MALSITHAFVNPKADGADTTIARPSDWNAAHTLSGIASAAQGGTNSAYFQAAGPTVARTYTFPDADATIARTDAANTFTGIQTFSTPIAVGSVATMTATVGGGVPTPPNNTTTFLRGDGTFAAPAAAGAALSGITAATGANTIASGANVDQIWNWAPTVDSKSAFTVGETTAATNGTSTSGVPNQVLLKLTTLAASTQSPLSVYVRGNHVLSASPTTTQMLGGVGTAALPLYSFSANTNCGMVGRVATPVAGLGFSDSGNVGLVVTSNTRVSVPAGTSASPGLSDITNQVMGITWNLNGSRSLSFLDNTSPNIRPFEIITDSTSIGTNIMYQAGAQTTGALLQFKKSRGSTASPTVITTGDDLATITGYGYVGATNTYLPAAQILFDSTGTIADATSGIGGQIKFSTTLAGTDTALQLGYTIQGGSNPITIRAPILFANLGTPANGSEAYCSDCDPPTLFNSTCASAGAKTGAFAQRINGAWIC